MVLVGEIGRWSFAQISASAYWKDILSDMSQHKFVLKLRCDNTSQVMIMVCGALSEHSPLLLL